MKIHVLTKEIAVNDKKLGGQKIFEKGFMCVTTFQR